MQTKSTFTDLSGGGRDSVSADTIVVPARFAETPEASHRTAQRLLRGAPSGLQVTPSVERWRRLARGLMMGDALADAVAACMHREGRRRVWMMFELALEQGIDQVDDPPIELRAFFDEIATVPAWVRLDLVEEGARAAALGGRAGMNALLVNGLMAGYRFSAINRVLLATGQLDGAVARRVAFTTQWWFDVTAQDRLGRFDEGFKSTVRVRLIHAMVRQRLAPGWSREDLGVPVNQTDMQATYLGFSTVYLLGLRMMGVVLSAHEKAAFMHRWRYLAWLSGVQDEFLHELKEEVVGGLIALYQNVMSQRLGDETTVQLTSALLEEPLARHYRFASAWMGRYNRAVLLSIASVSIGAEGLRQMGIRARPWPWYPLLMFLRNQLVHRGHRMFPGGSRRLARLGRRQQRAALDEVRGRKPALDHGIGSAAGKSNVSSR